jgi:hypothetical protein
MRVMIASALLVLAACSSAPKFEPWEVTEGMDSPESACVVGDKIFVSQVGGASPVEKDGNGRIVLLSIDGKVINKNWITGLNAPKGIRTFGNSLWTADIDEMVEVDIAAGKVARKIKIEGAKFLNDVATGPDGTVYVSDMALSRIYAIKDGKVSVFADGEELEYPNGVLVEGDHLVVGGWGKPEADFTTKVPGRLFKIDLKTKKKTLITKEPTGNLDGVEVDGKGGYIVTDWKAGKVMHITGDGKVQLLKQFKQGTADHAYLPATRTLILPHMLENRVAAYDLSEELP